MIETIEKWFESIKGYKPIKSEPKLRTAEECPEATLEEVLELAKKQCEWAEIDDLSDTLHAKQDFMHPSGLEIGWGNPLDAYRCKEGSGVYFFNAYKVD
jgi:hypothetical protein